MKKPLSLLTLIGILFFSSCITSLHPLYTEDTEVFDTSLLGRWTGKDQYFQFEKTGDKPYYKLTYSSEADGISEIEAHLVKLGQHYYLDFQRWQDLGDSYDFNVLAPTIDVHNFARIVWDERQLEIILFDGDKIYQLLKQRRARIQHEELEDDQFILTAKPKELQAFVTKYADELLDFSETLVLSKSAD